MPRTSASHASQWLACLAGSHIVYTLIVKVSVDLQALNHCTAGNHQIYSNGGVQGEGGGGGEG